MLFFILFCCTATAPGLPTLFSQAEPASFSFAKPDYWIARYNLSHNFLREAAFDEALYLPSFSYLSLDTVPAVVDKMENVEQNATKGIPYYESFRAQFLDYVSAMENYSPRYLGSVREAGPEQNTGPSVFHFNLSRHIARQELKAYFQTHQ